MLALCLLLCILASAHGLGLPEYIKSCSRNDPNLNECALKSARESLHQFSLGDSTRGLDPLDPLFVPVMTVYVPNENGLKLVFKDNSFTGLSVLRLDDLKFDLNKKMIMADALVSLDVTGQYDLSGKLLIIPIKSSGDSSIKLTKQLDDVTGDRRAGSFHAQRISIAIQRGNVASIIGTMPQGPYLDLENANLHIRFWYEHIDGDDGKIHWKITKHDIKYEVEKASFRLENLLNDKSIGDQVNKFLNEMWREIVADVGPSICQSLSAAVVQNLDKLLAQVPYDDLLPE